MGSRARLLPWLVFGAVVVVYASSFGNGFVYDDFEVILQQQPVRSLAEAGRIFAEPHGLPQSGLPYYRPTTRLSLLVQKGLHGEWAAPYHVFNAILMGAVAGVAWAILRRPRFGLTPVAAALGAAGFALHPVASSLVHPIASGRETLMPLLFSLLTVFAWLRGGASGRALAALGFGCAIFSKEQAIAVPLLLVAADALGLSPRDPEPTQERRPWTGARAWVWVKRFAPFAVITLVYLVVRGRVVPPEPGREGGLGMLLALVADTLLTEPAGPLLSLAYALQSVLAPSALLAYEPSVGAWFAGWRLGAAIAVLTAALWLLLRGRPADRAPVAYWLLWVPIAMALTLNFLPQEARFAERFVALSSLGLVAIVVTAGSRLAERAGQPKFFALFGLALVIGLALQSAARSVYYRDNIAFARQWVATNPAHGNAHYSLGASLARAGRTEEAIPALRRAIELEPALAAAHYNLGVLLAYQGRNEQAKTRFRRVLVLDDHDADAHYALGVLLANEGRREEARKHLGEALALEPGWAAPEAALRDLGGEAVEGR